MVKVRGVLAGALSPTWSTFVQMRPRSHAVIAGTGRAGTSFLVDFLRRVGVPTAGLSDAVEHDRARAGLERSLIEAGDSYLVKDPWLYEYVGDVDLDSVTIDALILPVRSLTAAAMSRVRLERAALVDASPRLAKWSSYGHTPGGLIYSLSLSDQEKVLAVGQARLIDWAVANDLPLFLLNYPRLVSDPEYLVDTLWPWLQRFTDRESAVATAGELSAPRRWESETIEVPATVPRDEHLSVLAHKEALDLHLAEKATETQRQQQMIGELERRLAERSSTVEVMTQRIEELERERTVAQSIENVSSVLRAEIQQREQEAVALAEATTRGSLLENELLTLQQTLATTSAALRQATSHSATIGIELQQLTHARDSLRAEVAAIKHSRSYRFGRLLSLPWRRGVRAVFRRRS